MQFFRQQHAVPLVELSLIKVKQSLSSGSMVHHTPNVTLSTKLNARTMLKAFVKAAKVQMVSGE